MKRVEGSRAVLSPSAPRATNPRLSAPSRRNRVAILRSRYKGQAIDVKRVGRELGVCYVLEEGQPRAWS